MLLCFNGSYICNRKRYLMKQLITFFGLAYAISWIIWLPLYGHIWGIHDLPVLPYHHALGGLGPLLASLFTTWIFLKNDGVKGLAKQIFQTRPVDYLGIALISPFALALLAVVINVLGSGKTVGMQAWFASREFPEFDFPVFFLYNLLFFGLGEEAGWRGFALPRFQKNMSALWSSVALTFFWAFWHWPLFFYRPGYMGMDIVGIIGWFLSLLTGCVLLTWLYNSSRGSIFICAVFHATIDIAFTADYADQHIVNYMGMLITLWGIATIFVFKPRHLSAERIIR